MVGFRGLEGKAGTLFQRKDVEYKLPLEDSPISGNIRKFLCKDVFLKMLGCIFSETSIMPQEKIQGHRED